MRASIPLTDDERAAVDDGQTALDALISRLADTPTPAGPTAHQLGIPATATCRTRTRARRPLLPILSVTQSPSH